MGLKTYNPTSPGRRQLITTDRSELWKGTPVKTLHVVILRPGTIKTGLRIPAGALQPGATYKIRVTAIDFDGPKTVNYVTFTA